MVMDVGHVGDYAVDLVGEVGHMFSVVEYGFQ